MEATDLTLDTAEIRLAIETGIKEALKQREKTAGDPRDNASPDHTTKGITISMTLEVDELVVGHDTDREPTASIPLLPVLALLVKRAGATKDATLALLKEVMHEALTIDKDATERLLSEAGVAEALEEVRLKVIATLPRTPVKKTVKAKGAKLAIISCAVKVA